MYTSEYTHYRSGVGAFGILGFFKVDSDFGFLLTLPLIKKDNLLNMFVSVVSMDDCE